MSKELDDLLALMTPTQRRVYDALAGGGRIYWQGGRRGGKFIIKRALDLRAQEQKEQE